MPTTADVDLSTLNNTHIENQDNLYIKPKSGTAQQQLKAHLHLIYEDHVLKQVLLTFPDFTSSDMSGYTHAHVPLATVSGSTWTFVDACVFHALEAMKKSASQVNNQNWKVGAIPSKEYFKPENERIPQQIAMVKIYAEYCKLVAELVSGLELATGKDLSALKG